MIFKSGYQITQGFGRSNTSFKMRKFYAKSGLIGHEGLDVAYKIWEEVPTILEDYRGQVVKVHDSPTGAYGRYITIWIKEKNIALQYCHLAAVYCAVGQIIHVGEPIGIMGESANGSEFYDPKKGVGVPLHCHINCIPVDDNGYRNGDIRNGYGGMVDPEPHFKGEKE